MASSCTNQTFAMCASTWVVSTPALFHTNAKVWQQSSPSPTQSKCTRTLNFHETFKYAHLVYDHTCVHYIPSCWCQACPNDLLVLHLYAQASYTWPILVFCLHLYPGLSMLGFTVYSVYCHEPSHCSWHYRLFRYFKINCTCTYLLARESRFVFWFSVLP